MIMKMKMIITTLISTFYFLHLSGKTLISNSCFDHLKLFQIFFVNDLLPLLRIIMRSSLI